MKFPKKDLDEGGGLFFKLKDGESKTGVLRGEVYEFAVIWNNKKSTIVAKGTEGAKSRYKVNIVLHEDNKFQAKVWEFSQTVCNQLADLAEEYDLTKTKLKISRKGSELNTEYSIIPTKEQLGVVQIKTIEQVILNILEHKDAKPMASSPNFDSDIPNFEDNPF